MASTVGTGTEAGPSTPARMIRQPSARGEDLRVTASAAGSCACGQDLDCCRREHCPRCGVTLPG